MGVGAWVGEGAGQPLLVGLLEGAGEPGDLVAAERGEAAAHDHSLEGAGASAARIDCNAEIRFV